MRLFNNNAIRSWVSLNYREVSAIKQVCYGGGSTAFDFGILQISCEQWTLSLDNKEMYIQPYLVILNGNSHLPQDHGTDYSRLSKMNILVY